MPRQATISHGYMIKQLSQSCGKILKFCGKARRDSPAHTVERKRSLRVNTITLALKVQRPPCVSTAVFRSGRTLQRRDKPPQLLGLRQDSPKHDTHVHDT